VAAAGETVEQPNDPPLIRLNAVGKSYSGAWVLKDATFSVSRGKIVGLVRENGDARYAN
jgi:ABC-type sugar transport system ATPase subunit